MKKIQLPATMSFATWIELLVARAEERADERVFTFLADGENETAHLTWTELDTRARAIAVQLLGSTGHGERALLLHPPGLDFVVAFLGCLYAGVIAVPAHPPRRRTLSRLGAIARDARPTVVLATSGNRAQLEKLCSGLAELDGARWLATDTASDRLAASWTPPSIDASTPAFLQYTSGSTATPKGVVVSHRNLLHNEAMIHRAFALDESSVIVGWLPLYHDMGLIGNVLQPLYAGASCVLLPPVAFLRRPGCWLRAISDYRATVSGGPNFAYELAARKIAAAERATLDLSSWRVAFNGAEPVRASTLEAFADTFAPAGFQRQALFPCYGLAEATLFVTGAEAGSGARIERYDARALEEHRAEPAAEGQRLVSSGRVDPALELTVVDPESRRRLAPGRVGEIWVSGPSVAAGYWNRSEQSRRELRASLAGAEAGTATFLRTGDLGFVAGDELFVTGRLKDLLILRGRNHYPQDIEATAATAHLALMLDGAAAFSVEVEGEERLVVVQEVQRQHRREATDPMLDAIRRAVAEEHGIQTHAVTLVAPGGVAKTSSGKVRRAACRAAWLAGELPVLGTATPAATGKAPAAASHARVRELVAEALASPAAELDDTTPLTALGLDSLTAVELEQRLRAEGLPAPPFEELLDGATLEDIAGYRRPEKGTPATDADPVVAHAIRRHEPADLPLTANQRAMWFLHRVAPESPVYHLSLALSLDPPPEPAALRHALDTLVARHPALRTLFPVSSDGEPTRRILDPRPAPLDEVSAETWSSRQIIEAAGEAIRRPFDLAAGPPLRCSVFRRKKDAVLLLVVHHIVSDFTSLAVLIEELATLLEGRPLEPLPEAHQDPAHAEVQWLAGNQARCALDYWRRELAAELPALALPTDRPRPPVPSGRGRVHVWKIDRVARDAVQKLAHGAGTTLFHPLLAIYTAFLHRLCAQSAISVGVPVAGRDGAGQARAVGYFVNPLVVHAEIPTGSRSETRFEELLARVSERFREAFRHRALPFQKLVEHLQLERDPSRTPLFQTLLVLQQAPRHPDAAAFGVPGAPARLRIGKLTLETFPIERRTTAFELTLSLATQDDGIVAALEYSSDLFDPTTIARWAASFDRLAAAVAEDPRRGLGTIELTSPAERHQMLVEWNVARSQLTDGREVTLPALCKRQARHTPDATALVAGAAVLSYAELERRVSSLAWDLRRRGVGRDDRVAVMLERSLEMVVAILAVHRAGAAHLPIDPSHPRERIDFMLADAGVTTVLGKGVDLPRVAGPARSPAPTPRIDPDQAAYVIYTSGSTGHPKGVVVAHRAIAHRVRWLIETFRFAGTDAVLQKTAFTFDASIWELYAPLVTGGRLIVGHPASHRDPAVLIDDVVRHAVTVLQVVPTFLGFLLAEPGFERCRTLRRVFSGGEALSDEHRRRFHDRLPKVELHNTYGPTEAAIDVAHHPVIRPHGAVAQFPTATVIPIGRPLPDTRLFITDPAGRPTPLGVAGELGISGVQLARGYLSRPALTAAVFVPDDLGPQPGDRRYRTGDQARFLANGEIEYLGRLDHQVKLRGLRIELGEIEATLAAHPGLAAAAVVVADDRLVAWTVPVAGSVPDRELTELLERHLPDYMVPRALRSVAVLPLLPSGKVDRRALVHEGRRLLATAEHVAPRSYEEELLAEVWCELLGVARVGVDDNFFELGGHSLLATRVAARVRTLFGVELEVRTFFEAQTVAELARRLAAARRSGEPPAPAITATELPGEQRPLSFAQERMWFLAMLDPDDPAYNVPVAAQLAQPLDAAALDAALAALRERHEVLRAYFPAPDGSPVVRLADTGPAWLRIDLRHLGAELAQIEARSRLEAEILRPFDLQVAPPMRCLVVDLPSATPLLVFNLHHIITDGWSSDILLRELDLLYGAARRGRTLRLPELPIRYVDWAVWQRRRLTSEALLPELEGWRQRLEGVPTLELPNDRPRRGRRHGATVLFTWPAARGAALRGLARSTGTTLFMTVLAGFAVLVTRLSGQREVAVGTPVAGRRHAELEGLLGLFVNTLVLRLDISGNPTGSALLAQARERTLTADAHQDIPFEKLVEELVTQRRQDTSPLFQALLVSAPTPPALKEMTPWGTDFENRTAKLDLTLTFAESADGTLWGGFNYRRELFDRTTIRRWTRHLEVLLDALAAGPEGPVAELPWLDRAQRHQLTREWSQPAASLSDVELLPARILDQARRFGDRTAVVFDDRRLSWAALDASSHRLAQRLRAAGVAPGDAVMVALHRSLEMVVAIVGIWRAGAAYVPIDPHTPAARLELIREDTRAQQVLTPSALSDLLAAPSSPAARAFRPPHPERPAYLIYTSGSTGRPKGVVVTHGQLASYVTAVLRRLECPEATSFALVLPLAVDSSKTALFPPLATGGTLHMVGEDTALDPEKLGAYLRRHPVDGMKIAPSHLEALVAGASSPRDLLPHRWLVMGGEAAARPFVERLLALPSACDVVNHYGPSETTVGVVAYRSRRRPFPGMVTMTLGYPLASATSHLTDATLSTVPAGVAGEIVIGGSTVAQGYLRRPAETAACFVPDVFSAALGRRLYRTGDVARRLADGRIEFLGRRDDQVKIRGLRVELGEIRAALLHHVAQAAVLTVPTADGEARLAAYCVPRDDGSPVHASPDALRSALRDTLPDYMVPDTFVMLDELPRNAHGKLDRRALPVPNWEHRGETAGEGAGPRTPTEEIVCAIWGEVLGRDRVGIDDDFFELGGHSLLATRITARLRRDLGAEVPVKALFEHPTVAALTPWVEAAGKAAGGRLLPTSEPGERPAEPPLSFAQERLWFLDQLDTASTSYNLSAALRGHGTFHEEALRRAIEETVRRQQGLRTRFPARRGRAYQLIDPAPRWTLPRVDLTALPDRETELHRILGRETSRRFDLVRGPLLRTVFFRLGSEDHVLLLALHHIVSDGWSTGVLVRELGALYRAFSAGRPSPLPELGLQYVDFALWQRRAFVGEMRAAQLAYWKERLEGAPILELPTDRPRPPVMSHRGALRPFRLDDEVGRGLRQLCRRAGTTLFMTALAGLEVVLRRHTQQRDLTVGTVIANRQRPELEDLVGFFVNTLALRVEVNGSAPFGELLERVRDVALGAYAHQDLPFEILVDELGVQRDLARTPLFQVVFVLQNTPLEAFRWPDLTLEPITLDPGTAKFDLVITLDDRTTALGGSIELATDLFDVSTIDRLASHVTMVLRGIVEDPTRRVDDLPFLGAAEHHQLTVEWNDREWGAAQAELGAGPLIHELFETQVAQRPAAVAVTAAGGVHLSYGELDRRAERLALDLRRRGAGPEARLGLRLERSAELVVGILGILKSGASYVPMDPAYPAQRLDFLASDAGTLAVVDTTEPAATADPPSDHRQGRRIGPEQAAYVIYTSGSTGRPKGVVVSHFNVVRLLTSTAHWFDFGPDDVWTLFHSYAFDFSVWELWGALAYGGRLCVVPHWVSRSPEDFHRLLAARRVTVLNQTPSAFRQLTAVASASPEPLALRAVVFGGEALDIPGLAPWFDRFGDSATRLVNMYGITETTVHVTYRPITRRDLDSPGSAIGRTIPDLRLDLLDRSGRPVPIGIPGELHVGGAGVARGYLGKPAWTAERFVPDPFGGPPGRRLYKSGDLGRTTASGDVHYLGRIDTQVKIRGFRIELGEIEAVLGTHPEVAESVVLMRDDAHPGEAPIRRLIAWLVARAAPGPDPETLRAWVGERLPDYMVPATFIALEALPLTAHGKIDRGALRRQKLPERETTERYSPPANPTEAILANVWSEVLGVDRVGRQDNFFALGGDSILSIRVVALAREHGLEIALPELFRQPTVAELAARLGAAEGAETPDAELSPIAPFDLLRAADRAALPAGVEDAYPLTRLQAGMLFHMRMVSEEPPYHNLDSYRIRGHLDPVRFTAAANRVVARHAVLRTAFDLETFSEPLQLVYASVPDSAVLIVDLRALSKAMHRPVIADFLRRHRSRPLDPLRPPLLRLVVHLLDEGEYQLNVLENHAIFDGWSLHSTLAEIFDEAQQPVDRRPSPRPAGLTFHDYVAMERHAEASPESRHYWREKLADAPFLALPRWPGRDRRPGETRTPVLEIHFTPELSEGLRRTAERAGVGIKHALLAGHLAALKILTGANDLVTGFVTNGRPETQGGEEIRGLFLNTLPLRVQMPPELSWLGLIERVATSEWELMAHRRYPLITLQQDLGSGDLFEVLFNYIHFHIVDPLLDGSGAGGGLEVLEHEIHDPANYPLVVSTSQQMGGDLVLMHLGYDADQFPATQVASIGRLFVRIYERLALSPDDLVESSVAALALSTVERHQVLVEWNDIGPAVLPDAARLPATVPEIVAVRASWTPDALALVDGPRMLSWGELEMRARSLGARLRSLGVTAETRVAIFANRSAAMVLGQLAVWKAGGAFVPLDPNYPEERLSYLLDSAGAPLLLTTSELAGRLPVEDRPVIRLDEAVARQPAELPPPAAESLAYVIYTSGSTGRPKGVAISHDNLRALCDWHCELFGVTRESRVSHLAGVSFDASIWEIWPCLAAGARLEVVPPDAVGVADRLAELLVARRITHGYGSTPIAEPLLGVEWPPHNVLDVVITGGDRLTRRPSADAPFVLSNNYGPTECTVVATSGWVRPAAGVDAPPSIGRTIPGIQIYVVDRRLVPSAFGVPGELVLGGRMVGRGYLDRPALTADRFLPDPFGPHCAGWDPHGGPGGRIYRTGDLVRLLPAGEIDFLSRMDHQVKVRGFRVELGEIETVLDAHPSIAAAVVLAREDRGATRLVAYTVSAHPAPKEGSGIEQDELQAYLREHLPEYMVPAVFMELTALPLTVNGKVDRAALQRLELADTSSEERFTPPRTVVEEIVAGIFSEVLEVERVGAHDDFFELGGHSLLATQIASRLRRSFALDLPLRQLFATPTVATLAAWIDGRRDASTVGERPPLVRVSTASRDAEAGLALSYAQERLWFLDRLHPGLTTYNYPVALKVEGELDVAVFEAAWRELIRRHEPLRTTFQSTGGGPVQVVGSVPDEVVGEVDLRALADPEAAARRLLATQLTRPFDLQEGPLLRVRLLHLKAGQQILMVVLHHIVTDGWSMGVLITELVELARAYAAGEAPTLPEPPITYADFALWQRAWLCGDEIERQLAYWRATLEGAPAELELATDRPRSVHRSFLGAARRHRLSAANVAALEGMARREGATLFMVVCAAWTALLARRSGQDDVVVGTPIANRTLPEIEGLIGFFVNTLALRIDLSGDPDTRTLLSRVRDVALGAYTHQDLPFERLIDALEIERSLDRTPLFQVMLGLQTTPRHGLARRGSVDAATAQLPGREGATVELWPIEHEVLTAPFDLTMILVPEEAGLRLDLEYSTDLFDTTTAEGLLRQFQRALTGFVSDSHPRVGELELLSAAERHQLVREWNDTLEREAASLPHLFERAAERYPDAIALVEGPTRLSYAELDDRSRRLARELLRRGVGADQLVATWLERSIDFVTAALAILRAGGAYLAFDVSLPRDRLSFMLEESGARWLITRRSELGDVLAIGPEVLVIEEVLARVPPWTGDLPSPSAASLAYAIYTSGSTGRPKGTLLPHRGLSFLVSWHGRAYAMAPGRRQCQIASLAFDASAWEIWPPLAYGASLIIVDRMVRLDPREFFTVVARQAVTHSVSPVALAEALMEAEWPPHLMFEALLIGGDRLHTTTARNRRVNWLNHYGPTEVSCVSSVGRVRPSHQRPSIGRPLPNLTLYIVDRRLRIVPRGSAGELLIGGPSGLARGYLHQPSLTAKHFIPDPWSRAEAGARLYRSGDLVRYLANGEVDFLGRIDHQVKIRGFRIELGEIEKVLGRHPAIELCAVVVREQGGDRRLAAFLETTAEVAPKELAAHLAKELPEVMVPSYFIALERLPRSTAGKVDRGVLARSALPEPVAATGPRDEEVLSPTAEIVAGIYSEILGHDAIGADDDFFALGGHSLLATQVASRLEAIFGMSVPVRQIFQTPVLGDLATWVQTERSAHGARRSTSIEPLAWDESGSSSRYPHGAPLSFAQERLWFLDRLAPGMTAYHIVQVLRMEGELQPAALAVAFEELTRRHATLRTTFQTVDAAPVQVVGPALRQLIEEIDLTTLVDPAAEVRRWVEAETERPFDLARGPLLRVRLFDLAPAEHALAVHMHHIVTDGWSTMVLVRELEELYAAALEARPHRLPDLPVTYTDFAVWQRSWLAGEELERQLDYWRRRLEGVPTALELTTDRPRPPVQTFHGASRTRSLSAGLASALEDLSRRQGATLFMTLLAAWSTLLARRSNQQDIVVGTPIANRTQPEIEGLVGFFVNTLALRVEVSGDASFTTLLSRVREWTLDAYAHQDLPFERLVDALEIERALDRSPLFQVLLAVQTAPRATRPPGAEPSPLRLSPMELEIRTAPFDLALSLAPGSAGLRCDLVFNSDLFDATSAERLLRAFERLLGAVTEHPGDRLATVELLTLGELHQVLGEANDTAASGPEAGSFFIDLFENAAHRAVDAVALVQGARRLSYAELDRRANRLAHHLLSRGVAAESLVGICVERSFAMVVAILGVLKSGAAYLPLDPDYPEDRLAYMVDDADLALVITDSKSRRRLPVAPQPTLELDGAGSAFAAESSSPPGRRVAADHLAYVIYTSGSTGRPKGVALTQGGLVHLALAQRHLLALRPDDRVLQFFALSFDGSVWEMTMAFARGAALVLGQPGLPLSGPILSGLVDRERITTATLPPSVLAATDGELGSLRTLIAAGEALTAELVARWRRGRRFFNAYGPSEATVCATAHLCRPGESPPPIGRPITFGQSYVVDRRLRAVGLGMAGELAIGGVALARGYLGQAAWTAGRFVPQPWSERPGGRLYRTGDLVRRLADGRIVFLGRIDHQVKLRGFRIELGEIEAAIAEQPGIRDVAVLIQGERLVAYCVADAPSVVGETLRRALTQRLPDYMVPSAYVALEALPLLPSGKLDRRALPEGELTAGGGVESVAPRDETERRMVEIWSEVLGQPVIGVRESFFHLGGHSLLAIRLLSRIEEELGCALALPTFFDAPTVERMAAIVRGAKRGARQPRPVLVEIQPGDSRIPFFCVHPVGGNVFCYLELARRLGSKQPFYGLQSPEAAISEDGFRTLEEMAAHYVDAVKSVRDSGPYCLGGWSMGGIVAYEMARQLEQQGEDIAVVAMLDAPPPPNGKAPGPLPDRATLLSSFLKDLQGTPSNVPLQELRQLEGDAQIDLAMQWAQRQGSLPPGTDRRLFLELFEIFCTNSKALTAYRPSPWSGRVEWIRSEASAAALPGNGWSALVEGGVAVHQVPGDHYSMLRPPHISHLVQRLEGLLAGDGEPRGYAESGRARDPRA